ARRHAEPAASARAPYRGSASARRHDRCDRAAAAPHGAVVESARVRRQALRSHRRGAGEMNTAHQRTAARPLLPLLAGALLLLLVLKLAVLIAFGPAIAPDSRDYIGYADQILSGAFHHVDLATDAIPLTLYRPIGYPAVIAAAKIIAPVHWARAVVIFQFAVSLVATCMVYRLARC